MASATLFLPLLLSLLLLSRPGEPAKAETSTFEVKVLPEVRGFLGDNVTLQCMLQTQEPDLQVSLVTWQRQEPTGVPVSIAVFHPTQGSNIPTPGRLEFLVARPGVKLRDASLVVRDLSAEDENNYTCHIATFPQGSKSAHTWLRVLAKPKNQAELEKVPLSPPSLGPVPVARCVSREGRPPPQISWSLDGKENKSQVPGHLPGTFTVTSVLALTPSSQVDGKNVTCTVEHESFQMPALLSLTLNVPYPPNVSISGYDGNWYLGREKATLKCDVRSNPKPTGYVWSTTTGSLPSSAVPNGSQLLIRPVDKSANTTFICRATNIVGTGEAEQPVLVKAEHPKHSSSKSSSLAVTVVSVVSVVSVLALLLFLLFLFRRKLPLRCSRRSRHSPGANNNVIFTALNTEASSPKDLDA